VTARLASLPKAAQVALVATVLLLVALIGYFSLISPKRSTAAALKKQTAAVQSEITSNRSSAFTQALPAVRSASVFSETEAMPNTLDTPDVLISLSQLAKDSGITFDQITPGGGGSSSTSSTSASAASASGAVATTTGDPFATEPISAKFTGSFYDLLAFLQRVNNLVRVQNGRLFTAGRLFDVSGVTLAEGPQGWPQVSATLVINEFVPQTVAPATVPGTTDTTSTTTTPATTTTSGTSAAPSTSGGTS
jgi:Tfp pilus assembly protein PilO